MYHLFVVNPLAGGGKRAAEVEEMAESFFKDKDETYEIYRTTGPMDAAREIKSRAIRGDEFRVYSCGGDGTFNECCNGAAGYKNVAVAPFPFGTGNDFIRMFGDEASLYRDLSAIYAGRVHPIDLIDVNGRYCVGISSVGVDARIGTNVHKYTKIPLFGNSAAYVVSVIVEVMRGINTYMRITCGDFTATGPMALCSVCNGRCYGGGFQPSLDAMPDDGVLDIFVCKEMHLPALAANIGKYAAGKADSVPKWITHLQSDSITIETKEDVVVNIDGEAIYGKKIEMKLIPGALNLIVPNGMTFFDKK